MKTQAPLRRPRQRVRLALLPLLGSLVLALPILAGCDLLTAEDPLALTASLEADPVNPQVGEAVRFSAEGTGDMLAAIILDFGDGGSDLQEFGGGRRATVEREWVYEEPGTYQVILQVVEFSGARAQASTEIVVSPSPAP